MIAIFVKYETWETKENCLAAGYEKAAMDWLRYLSGNRDDLCNELAGVKYYRQCTKDGEPTGVYALLQEFKSGSDYFKFNEKVRRSVGSGDRELGAFADYMKLDPRAGAIPDTLESVFMLPKKTDIWFDYTHSKLETEKKYGVSLRRFLEYETWRVDPAVSREGYENMIETWFRYVVEHKTQLFREWVSAKYYAQCDANGVINGVYVMMFEYDSIEGHHAYKSRKLYSYAMNDGVYAQYAENDPYQFFDMASVNIDCLQPLFPELWI